MAIAGLAGGEFPGRNVDVRFYDTADVYALEWFGYADYWETLLSTWEDDVFTAMWPGIPLPYAGLAACLKVDAAASIAPPMVCPSGFSGLSGSSRLGRWCRWSTERGEAKQLELIGMTAAAE